MKQYRTLFAFIALILAVSLACGIDFGTSTPATSEPSQFQPPVNNPPIEIASPEPPATDSPAANDKYFTEEFEGDISSWTYFVTKNDTTADDSGDLAPYTENGYLVLDLKKYLNVYTIYEGGTYDNVRLDVRVDNRGTNNNNINLVCRYSKEGWYEIAIANNGLYWLFAYDGVKGRYVKLADGGSNKIKAGKEVNEYSFICNDRNLILYINGNETKRYTDNVFVFRDGQVGIGLSSFKDIPTKVEFDWVKVSQP
jgi:hypothetical protein